MASIIALAKMLDLATDQLSQRMGQTLGALLNASFGNAVEVIVGVMALRKGLVTVVQASLLGSVLSNLLLVLGFSFFVGGLKYSTQSFSISAGLQYDSSPANINASLLSLSMIGFLLPAALGHSSSVAVLAVSPEKILMFSRGTSVLLLLTYIAYLVFQLKTHPHFFKPAIEAEEEEEHPIVNVKIAVGTLIVSTVLIGISAEMLVSSIEGIGRIWGLSDTFIGLIILPVVGNAAEHVTAVYASLRNKMDLSIGVSLGSSLQISIFVTPLLVLVGWVMNVPLSLDFPIFDIAVVFVTILTVSNLINDGQSNWLEGFLLLVIYLIICFAYYLY